jgi:hypothetical protein
MCTAAPTDGIPCAIAKTSSSGNALRFLPICSGNRFRHRTFLRPWCGLVPGIKPESRGNPMDKTNTTALPASPEEKAAPPVLLTKPEEKTDAPNVLKLGDDTKNAPKPAATNDQTPVTE